MILLDTSVWLDHYRSSNATVVQLLNDGHVLSHPFVCGELACGNLRNRETTLRLHQLLPQAARVYDGEILAFIEANDLSAKGIGLVDVHLLASTLLTSDAQIWSLDRRLADAARALGIAFEPDLYPRIDGDGRAVYEGVPENATDVIEKEGM